jgi:hypothetical protein
VVPAASPSVPSPPNRSASRASRAAGYEEASGPHEAGVEPFTPQLNCLLSIVSSYGKPCVPFLYHQIIGFQWLNH